MIQYKKYTLKIESEVPEEIIEQMSVKDRKSLYLINGMIYISEKNTTYGGIIVAYLEDEPVGFCHYKVKGYAGMIVLEKIYFKKDHRGKGIIKKMCNIIEDMSSDMLWHAWCLEVYDFNKEAIKTYQKWGYKKIGKRLQYFNYKGVPGFSYQYYKKR